MMLNISCEEALNVYKPSNNDIHQRYRLGIDTYNVVLHIILRNFDVFAWNNSHYHSSSHHKASRRVFIILVANNMT